MGEDRGREGEASFSSLAARLSGGPAWRQQEHGGRPEGRGWLPDPADHEGAPLPAAGSCDPTSFLPTPSSPHEPGTHHSWKLAAWVESQKLMPMTAVADSPGARDSAEVRQGIRERHCHLTGLQRAPLGNPGFLGPSRLFLAFSRSLNPAQPPISVSPEMTKPQAPPTLIRTCLFPLLTCPTGHRPC